MDIIGFVLAIVVLPTIAIVVVLALYLIGLEWWLRREKKIAEHVNWLRQFGLRETCFFIYRFSCDVKE